MDQGPSYWFDTRIYLAVSVALLLIIMFYNPYIAAPGAIAVYALFLYGRERRLEQQKKCASFLQFMSEHIGPPPFYALQNIPMAIVVIGEDGAIHWSNKVMKEWTGGKAEAGEMITKVWPGRYRRGNIGQRIAAKFYIPEIEIIRCCINLFLIKVPQRRVKKVLVS